MARHRRSQDEGVPPELLEANYNPRDWPLGPAGTTPRQRWRAAQFEWLEQHPERTIGGADAVDLIFIVDPDDLTALNRLFAN
jgi:hypothetical protein